MHICTHCVWLKCLSNWSQWDIIFTDKDTKLRWKEIMLSIKTWLPSIIFAAIWILPIAIPITYLLMIHSFRYIHKWKAQFQCNLPVIHKIKCFYLGCAAGIRSFAFLSNHKYHDGYPKENLECNQSLPSFANCACLR